ARNENARTLMADPVAFSFAAGMGQDLQRRVARHAGVLQRRALSQTQDNALPFISADRVLEVAQGRMGEIVTDLLGSPHARLSSKTALRFGNKGSLVVTIS